MADVIYVTDVGLGIVTGKVKTPAGADPKWVGWGTGTTAAVVGNTVLETPSAEARTVGTMTRTNTGGTTNDTYQVVALITSTTAGSQAITEVGVFNALTIGSLYLRATFSSIAVSQGDSIEFTIRTTFNQA